MCSANAQFVLKHDQAGHFYLASMQGAAGSALYRKFGIDPHDPDTMIVVVGDRALRNSDAVLAIYGRLGWPWRAAVAFKIVPRPVRDAIYLFLARNRYRLFGRRDRCWVPDAAQAERVL